MWLESSVLDSAILESGSLAVGMPGPPVENVR